MKRIMVIDGGPRKNMNTAALCEKFAEGARDAGADVKVVRLYGINFKGCMSCMACKLKDKATHICKFKDELKPILEEIATADGIALASPIYFGSVTAEMHAFLERLEFPWLSYNDYSLTAPKKMPVVLMETMNGTPEQNNSQGFGAKEMCITAALGLPEKLVAYNTCQVKNYDNYELGMFSKEAKHQWHDEHWEKDLQSAYEAGKRMVEAQ